MKNLAVVANQVQQVERCESADWLVMEYGNNGHGTDVVSEIDQKYWKQPIPTDIRANKNVDMLSRLLFYETISMCQNKDFNFHFMHGNKKISLELKRGQCLLRVKPISEALKIDRKRVRKCLETISKWYTEMDIETKPYGLVITYKEYDSIIKMVSEMESERTSKGHRKDKQEQECIKNEENKERLKEIDSRFTGMEFHSALSEFKQMRTKIKKPLTDKALTRMLNKLSKIEDDPVKVLNQSCDFDWQDIYPLKHKHESGVVL